MKNELLELLEEYGEEMSFTEERQTNYGTAILHKTVPVIRIQHILNFLKSYDKPINEEEEIDARFRQKNPIDFILRKNVLN